MAIDVIAQVRGQVGFLTLNRPLALNALTLHMVRMLTAQLLAWKDDPQVLAVAIRGCDKEGDFGHLCGGGDIRFFHQAGSAGNPQLDDFFTEEYALNHLIYSYPKPYIAFMDGFVMGAGMGLSQGARLRIVTENTKMAMPETMIGMIPDVGAGYFLARCPGAVGEWLALTGEVVQAADALAFNLADVYLPVSEQVHLWEALGHPAFAHSDAILALVKIQTQRFVSEAPRHTKEIHHIFSLPTVMAIVRQLESEQSAWAQATARVLRKKSPLLLCVTLEQIRRARGQSMAHVLRMERDVMRHCFQLRHGHSDALEGIRAFMIDKDQKPQWQPSRVEDVDTERVQAFFQSPWPAYAHPLAALAG